MCISKYAAYDAIFTQIWSIYRKFERLSAMEGSLMPSWRFTRWLFNVAIVVDVGGADGIDPCRNIANISQSKYVPTVRGVEEIKGGARRPTEPETKEPT